MLKQNQVLAKFKDLLNQKELSYSDTFNFEIQNTLGISCNELLYPEFYDSFTNLNEIPKWIDQVKSKLVMLEDIDSSEEIIFSLIEDRIINFKIQH